MTLSSEQRDTVRREVRRLLEQSPAYRSLPAERQAAIAHDTATVADAMSEDGYPPAGEASAGKVDFPRFVADLVRGTFQAVVDSSIQQMEAYGELVKSVAGSVGELANEDVSTDKRDGLPGRHDHRPPHPKLARGRQQALATMVMQRIAKLRGAPDDPDD